MNLSKPDHFHKTVKSVRKDRVTGRSIPETRINRTTKPGKKRLTRRSNLLSLFYGNNYEFKEVSCEIYGKTETGNPVYGKTGSDLASIVMCEVLVETGFLEYYSENRLMLSSA